MNGVLEAAARCREAGIHPEVVKLPTLAPLDLDTVAASVEKTGRLVMVEECAEQACIAPRVIAGLTERGLRFSCAHRTLGKRFVTHGSVPELRAIAGLDADGIFSLIREVVHHEA